MRDKRTKYFRQHRTPRGNEEGIPVYLDDVRASDVPHGSIILSDPSGMAVNANHGYVPRWEHIRVIDEFGELFDIRGEFRITMCACGCGLPLFLDAAEWSHYCLWRYFPINAPCYSRIRRRFKGRTRPSKTLGVKWVRFKGGPF